MPNKKKPFPKNKHDTKSWQKRNEARKPKQLDYAKQMDADAAAITAAENQTEEVTNG